MSIADTALVDAVQRHARILMGDVHDYDHLMGLVGDAHFVLIGEASHGTHEFYQERARITQRLIAEKGFTAVAIEGDWPDAYRVNRYILDISDDDTASQALAGFQRFPTWMWRNTDVVSFVEWLRLYNDSQSLNHSKVGFYGLDLYSMNTSMAAVLTYLDLVDPSAAQRARQRYACFDHFSHDSQIYGMMTGLGAKRSCEEAVISQLTDLQQRTAEAVRNHPKIDTDEAFYAEQNARLVKNAERYYRSMYLSNVRSWNLRDQHMMETLNALVSHLERRGNPVKVVVWAHNSHLGDARATEMGQKRRELNLGQLVRVRYGRDAILIGLTTHHGSVMAASDWEAPAQIKSVLPALSGSYEALFHETRLARFMLPLQGTNELTLALRERRLERAIGVIYRPDTERQSHYFYAQLPDQFNVVLHFDRTYAVRPLERMAPHPDVEAPETYPSGI